MRLPAKLARNLYWGFQPLRGRASVRTRLAWLSTTQHLPLSDIRELQFQKLRAVLEHAYATVPYYRRCMKERGLVPADFTSGADLAKLPLLTRSTLFAEQNALMSSEADFSTLKTNYSSGSTGQRAVFAQDEEFRLWARAHQLRTYRWCAGFEIGEPFVLLWGSEIYFDMKQVVDFVDNALANRREFNTFRLSNQLLRKFLDEIVRFKPVLISTYANAMNLLAREAEQRNIKVPSLRCIQGTSEPMPPAMRERMSSIFGCEILDKYGSRETNIVSHECMRHDGMHIQAENAFVEVVDDDGNPLPPGQKGRVVITTLNNQSMPLIRYATSDIAYLIPDEPCACGIGMPRMSHVAGREHDLIRTPNGDSIDAYFFTYLLMRFEEIHWFQVIQPALNKLFIRVLTPRPLDDALIAQIKDRVMHHTGYAFELEIERLSEMPETKTGKFRLCISELGSVA